jgi:MFS family permease
VPSQRTPPATSARVLWKRVGDPPDFPYSLGMATLNPTRALLALSLSQAIATAAMSGAFMMGSLLLVSMSGGSAAWAGVPSAVMMTSSALILQPLARWKDRHGYRAVLGMAFIVGAAGGCLAAGGAALGSRMLLMSAFVLFGAANGGIQLCRFAAAEMVPPERRGKAMSIVITGATAGALGGPLLAHAAEKAGALASLPAALAPFLALSLIYLAGFPAVLPAMARATSTPPPAPSAPGATIAPAPRSRLLYAIGTMVFGQVAMVFLMAVTPVHMHQHHHSTGSISLVLTVHFLGMFGLSVLGGWLADRFGRIQTICLGSALLILSYLIGKLSVSLPAVLGALFLLGLGWNFVFLSGSVLLSDSLKGRNRGRIQGISDGAVAFGSAVAGLASGLLLGALGYDGIAWVGLALGAVPLLLLPLARQRS